jgi:hypothetical protein
MTPSRTRPGNLKLLLAVATIVACYGASLGAPVFADTPPVRGYQAFSAALSHRETVLLWLANPLLWFGIYALARAGWLVATLCGLGALLLTGGSSYWLSQSPPGVTFNFLTADLGIGLYLWLASMVLLTLAGAACWYHAHLPSVRLRRLLDSLPDDWPAGPHRPRQFDVLRTVQNRKVR